MNVLAPLALSLLFSANAPSTDVATADAGFTALLAAHDAAWNRHDAKAFVALFTDDATLVTPAGTRAEGRAALLTLLSGDGPSKRTTSKARLEAVQWLGKDMAVIDVTQKLSGPGTAVLGTDARLVAVVVRKNGAWRFAAARPHVAPAPAASTARSSTPSR